MLFIGLSWLNWFVILSMLFGGYVRWVLRLLWLFVLIWVRFVCLFSRCVGMFVGCCATSWWFRLLLLWVLVVELFCLVICLVCCSFFGMTCSATISFICWLLGMLRWLWRCCCFVWMFLVCVFVPVWLVCLLFSGLSGLLRLLYRLLFVLVVRLLLFSDLGFWLFVVVCGFSYVAVGFVRLLLYC